MEWFIILDPLDDSYLVMTDYHTLRDEEDICWLGTLDFTRITSSDIKVADFILRNSRLRVLHKFTSDDPLTYVNNLQSTHPELFI